MKHFLVVLGLFLGINLFFAQENNSKNNSLLLVYGSETCDVCIKTKQFLKENNIPFVFYDIDTNTEKLKEMLLKLRQNNIPTNNLHIPVIDKNGLIFTNEENFEHFLNKLKP
jgi:glutaredoxin